MGYICEAWFINLLQQPWITKKWSSASQEQQDKSPTHSYPNSAEDSASQESNYTSDF